MQSWIRRLMPDKRFLGSNWPSRLASWASCPAVVQDGSSGTGGIAGLIMILGAVAYRSRKRRLLGLLPATLARKIREALALVAILLGVGLQRDLGALLAADPVPNLIAPLWALIAYFCAGIRIRHKTDQSN